MKHRDHDRPVDSPSLYPPDTEDVQMLGGESFTVELPPRHRAPFVLIQP